MKKYVLVPLLVYLLFFESCQPSGDIVVYGRENNSGTYLYFKEVALKGAFFMPEMQTLPGTAAVINAVSKAKKSIGFGGIGYSKGVNVVAVQKDSQSPPYLPTIENVVSRKYPLSRYLYLYTVGEPTDAAKEFIDWILSEEGQKVCADVGYYPLPKKNVMPTPQLGQSQKQSIQMNGSDTMVILGQRWAEYYMKKKKDTSISVTGGGTGTGIAALMNGSTDICMASREIKQEEKDEIRKKHGKPTIEFKVAMDGLAIFVNKENPLKQITLDQINKIYSGKMKNWNELGLSW